ncbi:hypothetical protein OH687_32935 [Burkholderia anthina]|nr:hypothetical protein OH687_32935 [Burkholderia anthina]
MRRVLMREVRMNLKDSRMLEVWFEFFRGDGYFLLKIK